MIDRRGQAFEYSDGTQRYEAYVVEPGAAHAGPCPCVLLMHDWSGVNDGMRKVALKVAALGYVAFAADVYGKGRRGSETGDNSALMNPLLADRALLRERLLLAHEAARLNPRVDGGRVMAMGYCFGGLCALDLARAGPDGLLGAISVHGVLSPPDIGAQAPISARILLLHGWDDPFAPAGDVLSIAQELDAAKADWQLHAYGGVKHAFSFERADKPDQGIAYDAAAARRSWQATENFLNEIFASRN